MVREEAAGRYSIPRPYGRGIAGGVIKMFNRCPNQQRIDFENRVLAIHNDRSMILHKNAREDAEQILQLNPDTIITTDALAEIFKLEDGLTTRRFIDGRLDKLADTACKKCGGIVMDPTCGLAYCGNNPPSEVIMNNARLD